MAAKLSGGGKGKFELGQNADINVTPFVDVMLVLLIIFMVAAPLATVAIKIDLPPPNKDQPKPDKPPVLVDIRRDGQVFLGSTPTTYDALATDLAKALDVPAPFEEQILIHADRYVDYARFMGVLNLLQTGGYHKLALIAEDL